MCSLPPFIEPKTVGPRPSDSRGDFAGLPYCWKSFVKLRAPTLLALLFLLLLALGNVAMIAGAADCGSATPTWRCKIAAWFAG